METVLSCLSQGGQKGPKKRPHEVLGEAPCDMEVGQEPPPPQDTIRRAFRSLSIKPSLPLRAPSLQTIPQARVRKPSLSFQAPSLQSIPQVREPPTVCAKAHQSDTPDQPFRSAMLHRGIAPVGTASFSRPSPLARPSHETISWLSSPDSALRKERFGGATLLYPPRGLRVARAASAFDFTPAAAATRLAPREDDTWLCIAWRTERNALPRHRPQFGTEEAAPPRLPGALRFAQGHAPRVRRAMTSLASINSDRFPQPSILGIQISAMKRRNSSFPGSEPRAEN